MLPFSPRAICFYLSQIPHNGAERDSRGCALSHKRIAHGRGSVPEAVPEFDPTPRESPGGSYSLSKLSLSLFFIGSLPAPVSPLSLSEAASTRLPKLPGRLGSNSGIPPALAGIATRQPRIRTKDSDPGGRIGRTWVGVCEVFA